MSNPNSMSIVTTTTVSQKHNNCAYISDVGTTSKTLTMNMTTDLTVTQEISLTYKSFTIECTHTPNSIFMTDWKRSNSSHIWDNSVLIDCEKLKVVIEKAMSVVINMEGMHDEFSVKSFYPTK